ncbi:MAG: Spy/CpxP family protein refolding chaperone [Hyphomonadaceae bacterium]
MTKVWRTFIVTALVAFAAGAAGVYLGQKFFSGRADHGSLDAAVHRELDLSADQEERLEAIEARFAERRGALETEMRAATREISDALMEDKAYTPRVQQAVDHFHETMGQLQHETILHVFEMREVLTPEQQAEFDEIVRRDLLRSSDQSD